MPLGITAQETPNPLKGKIIALDAGHGGSDNGTRNLTYGVVEKDVNLAVVYALKEKLENAGANVILTRICDENIPSRKDRVDLAMERCKSLGRKCDVLASVHHNGSTNPEIDGTMVIYNEKQDKPLAIALHNALITELGLPDQGYEKGGYGMTVYGHLVSVITEAYYISNDWEALQYLAGEETAVCQNYSVHQGTRVDQEADALYQGLIDYFADSSENGNGKPDKCTPWPECKKK